jgi:hypothetical protein
MKKSGVRQKGEQVLFFQLKYLVSMGGGAVLAVVGLVIQGMM